MTPEMCRAMAAYNRWQNQQAYAACDGLDDAARRRDRGAFFRSIHETLDHLVWADEIWLSRFGGCAPPQGGIADSTQRHGDWDALSEKRKTVDQWLLDWASALAPKDLAGEMSWFSGAAGREIRRERALLVQHMFNHQTHHRGQVHAMITAAGADGPISDLFLMPGLS